MAKTPYQPFLLRSLHGAVAVAVLLAWLSGAVVYSNHDGRLLRLPLQLPGNWIDIHGTAGVILWPIALLFALYAITRGRARLRQPANITALVALVLAVGSGKLMQEEWLRSGQFDQLVYHLHLLAWLLIAAAVAWHVKAVITRGGIPLARSMVMLHVHERDNTGRWAMQIWSGLRRIGSPSQKPRV